MLSHRRRSPWQARQPEPDSAARGASLWRLAAVFAATGALALGIQVLLLREYLVTLQGDEVSIGLGLASWLAGISVGAGLARSAGRRRPDWVAAWALGLLAILGWASLFVARLGRRLLAVPTGELAALGPSLLLALLVFALPGAMVGAGFVGLACSAQRVGVAPGKAVSTLYVAEATGALLSGLVVSLVLIPTVSPLTALGLLASMSLAAAVPAARAGTIAGRWLLPALCTVTLLAALPPLSRPMEARSERARFAALAAGMPLIDWANTPYEHLALGGVDEHVLYAGGQYRTSFPDPVEDEGQAHRLMLLTRNPARVLAFGSLQAGMLRFMLRHPVTRIDWVLYHPRELDLVKRHLDMADRQALADPRVHITYRDPRRFLAESSAQYDLIFCLEADPSTLLLARDRSVEFLKLVARRLSPRGTYVSRFSAGPNVQAGETGTLGAALYRSLKAAFSVVHATPGPEGLFVSGHSPDSVTLSPGRLTERWRKRGLESDVFIPELLPLLYPPERVGALEQELARQAESLEPSRDDRPISFLHASAVRGQLAGSAWPAVLRWATSHRITLALAGLGPSLLLACYLGLLRLGRRRRRSRTSPGVLHATAVTGAAGMAYSVMLLYSFQSRVGLLYSEIGALTAVFMLGLALGGLLGSRPAFLPRAQALGFMTSLLVALSFALMNRFSTPGTVLALSHGMLFVLTGAATGVVFPAATQTLINRGGRLERTAAFVELADHAGAAMAALLAPTMFVPVLGLTLSAALLVLLQGLALLVTLASASSLEASHRKRPSRPVSPSGRLGPPP
jgi:spermidine synthase